MIARRIWPAIALEPRGLGLRSGDVAPRSAEITLSPLRLLGFGPLDGALPDFIVSTVCLSVRLSHLEISR